MNPLLLLFLSLFVECVLGRGPPFLWPNASNFVTLNVHENDPIELLCPVTHTSDLSIQWAKNNEELDPMWSTGNLLIKRLLLRIPRVQSTDAGLYRCNVVNGFGSVQAQFRVNVQANGTMPQPVASNEPMAWDLDSLSGEAPEFLARGDEAPLGATTVIQPEGTTVQLKCLASGKPVPEIRWKKNGKILSEDEYGVTQSQILIIKDLRQSDTGNYTCEVFNSFGTINATFILLVTEKLQFFGNDPQNTSVELGRPAALHCRVQTRESRTKIQWLKRIDAQQIFRADAIVFGSEQYENVDPSQEQPTEYSNHLLSKSLLFSASTSKDHGQYICLIQNEKVTNYKSAFLHVINHRKGLISSVNNATENNLLYVIVVPLCLLGLLVLLIFCCRHRRRKSTRHQRHHSHCSDSVKSSAKARQPFIHPTGAVMPASTTRTSNDYIATSVDSIPIPRQYQQQPRYGLPLSADLASLTSSNLYYARVQAL